MSNPNDLAYLNKEFPYLFEIEKEVQRVKARTGYGDVNFTLRIVNGEVDSGEIYGIAKMIFKKRRDNAL